MGLPKQKIVETLYAYKAMPHRFEKVLSSDITWIDDSKATNVGATIAALKGLGNDFDFVVLIVGGDAKGADISPLNTFLGNPVNVLITLGKDAALFSQLAVEYKDQNTATRLVCEHADDMNSAVQTAYFIGKQQVLHGNRVLVLLSPACASIDMFKNYQHRGKVFRDAVLSQEGIQCNQ